MDENGKPRPIRGSPFRPTLTKMARNRANEYSGPVVTAWLGSTLKSLDEFYQTTNTGHQTKLKEGDVMNLIKVMNHIKDMYDQEDTLILRQDEVVETLAQLEREGLPSDKQLKQLKKIGANLVQLKQDIVAKEKEIQPMVQKESEFYKKAIGDFENELKTYQGGLKKEAYYFYKSGLELAQKRLSDVTTDLDNFDKRMDDLLHIATNFNYPEELNNSKKIMQAMREDVANCKGLWEFEVQRIKITEGFLVVRWGQVVAGDMEDEIKALFKKLKEVKVDRKCDAFVGVQDVVKKWTVFCPLVGELRDPAMRQRHWAQLMDQCGKSITVTPDILLRDMWNLELHKNPDFVEDTADQAKQEMKMENTLKKLQKEWAEVDFGFDSHRGTEVMLMKMADDKFEMLEEHQVAVQNMFSSRFLATFEEQVTSWQKTLANISEVSTLLSEVQRSWVFLENLFIFSDEVKKELPEDGTESDKFVGIDMDVKEILMNGYQIKSAKEFCNQGNIFQKLEKVQGALEMCQKALNDFMDSKKRAFPRFYFMSSNDLLDVLSNGNQPAKARLLRVSARNSLIWDGSTPVPVAPAKSLSWLLPCSDKMALRIAKLQEKLRSSGWKIVTSPVHIIQSLGNKAQFPVYAAKIGMLSFLPCHFSSPEMAAYPCVLKPAKGEYGKNTYICHSKEEVYQVSPEFSTAKWVLQELVPGNVEFSVSLLVLHGSIVDVIGMKYVYDKSIYIWPKVTELHRHLCDVPVQHTAVMARFLAEYDGIVNFNYKFPKFFIAIDNYTLEFPDGDGWVTADRLKSWLEYVPFPEPLPLLGKVESYLDKCIEWFQKALKFFAKQDKEKYFTEGCMDDGFKRGEFIASSQAAQCALLVQLITWVMLVENDAAPPLEDGKEDAVHDAWQESHRLLLKLIEPERCLSAFPLPKAAKQPEMFCGGRMEEKTMTNLDKPTRQKIMCAITLDAHNRDVQERLVQEKVSSKDAFQWQSMLKCYWKEDVDDASMEIADAKLLYGYEYLGNGPRLVVTPLTDRIYVTATQALHLCMGCAPAGPAGTGKTESTKDLANAVAKACYVINAAPEMDYLTLGDIYKGLSASGSWGCFDEFNRLVPEVLSVCTVQFKAVCDAIRAKQQRFMLQGDEINLNPQVGCFITMNPGYLGRSELPEGLKALFRPITVMVPDFKLIMENMFMGEGFTEAKALGLKFSTLYALNKDLLSVLAMNEPMWVSDWGMRAIKSVLVVAGGFKRADPSLSEQAVLMRSLRDTNVAKIEGDDLRIFMALLKDLFPGIDVPRARDYEMEEVLVDVMQADYGYTHDPDGYLLLKITQLIELLGIRHCVFLMGNPGSFKSAMWKVLKNAKTRRGEKTTTVDFSPKAISTNELYGFVNMQTREWKDGIISKVMRDLGQVPDTHPKWIMLDGDLDANWIESMNSVMDDNRLLTLPSNERIPLKVHMKMIFEIRDLNYATPATATRAGIVCPASQRFGGMDDTFGVQWRSYVKSWVQKQEHPDNIKDQLWNFFEKCGASTTHWMLKNVKILVPMVDICLISACCSLLDNLLTPATYDSLEYWFMFCFTAACGLCLAEVDGVDYRKNFSNWWKGEMKTVKYPSKGGIFDYYVKDAKFEEWSTAVETLEYSSETPMGEITVPTNETVAMTFLMRALIEQHHPVMLIGLAGCGKTQSCLGLLKSLPPDVFTFYAMNMSYYTDSTLLQTMMENPLEKKAGKLYAPPGKLQLIYFVDDLNMPALDKYNTQSAIELMKQKQDYGHWYDRQKILIKDIGNTQYLCCMNPTAGSFIVNQRLQRHFWTCAVPFPEQSALLTIYSTFMKGHFERLPFKGPVQEQVSGIIKAALSLHSMVVSSFRKTASNFHYEFNIRHMSGVFSGLLQAKPGEFADAEKVVLLWIHESERIYGDRLVSPTDLKKYRALAADLSKKMFGALGVGKFNFAKYFQEKNPEPLVFAPFSKGIQEMDGGGFYDKIPSTERLSALLGEALREYNENNAAMDLVLFNDAMCHVGKICRIITSTPGHPLLVGVGGSGRQSLSRLSSYTCLYSTTMIVISGNYGMNDLKGDLQAMYMRAGVKDEGVLFLFTDGQITNEKFLVFINDLLASGDIADLYASDEKDAIRNGVRSGCKGAGIQDTPENLWSFFISRIRKNLHMSLCFSPVGDAMRNRARKFPALVNCTVIDWFQPWPMDALYNVGAKFLEPIEQLGPQDSPVRNGIMDFLPFSFEAAGQVAQNFMTVQRRFAYTTPKSFLELIKLYTSMVGQKVDALEDQKDRLTSGLEKLRATSEQVAGLEEELKEKAVVVAEKAAAADVFATEVGEKKATVQEESAKAAVEAEKCAKIAKDVSIQQADCEKDLAAAIPLVEQAEKALDVLDKKDFQELKALAKPPGGVDLVLEAAMHLQARVSLACAHLRSSGGRSKEFVSG
ncbi:unnamed protein product [Durusdinium trenchii]|uniref:Dynein heavy chain n=1 Tax=Durusdinium trenchii TaxID=1381693 RepID=A0ABP0JPK5_9DINO